MGDLSVFDQNQSAQAENQISRLSPNCSVGIKTGQTTKRTIRKIKKKKCLQSKFICQFYDYLNI